MARMNENEKGALRQAAEAAMAMILKLEQEKAKLDDRITTLRTITDAWATFSGKRPKLTSQALPAAGVTEADKIPRGQAKLHVDAILMGGEEFNEPTIRRMIADKFHVNHSRPAVYNVLRRGKKDGKYIKTGTKWGMSQTAILEAEVFGEESLV